MERVLHTLADGLIALEGSALQGGMLAPGEICESYPWPEEPGMEPMEPQ